MKWADGPLVLGTFVERLHRFGALVEVKGIREYCHVPNSGRLRELLFPGSRVALVDPPTRFLSHTKTPRKTRYAIRLAYYKKKWVCIEANIAPKLLAEAWEQGNIPSLKAYPEWQAEVPFNAHTRFDFQARNTQTGEKAWIEVKCVTLVNSKGIAYFPDAPSERASKHLKELMVLSKKPKTKCFVFFIVQNPFAKAFAPKDDTDPFFGKTLRQSARTDLQLRAYSAQVHLKGARILQSIPLLLK